VVRRAGRQQATDTDDDRRHQPDAAQLPAGAAAVLRLGGATAGDGRRHPQDHDVPAADHDNADDDNPTADDHDDAAPDDHHHDNNDDRDAHDHAVCGRQQRQPEAVIVTDSEECW
jgi:hypothetical protein